MAFDEDEDDQHENILKSLGDEVDDYAGDQLPEDAKNAGITLEITIKPKQMAQSIPDEKGDGKEDEDHDPVAHILGMCGGGCAR